MAEPLTEAEEWLRVVIAAIGQIALVRVVEMDTGPARLVEVPRQGFVSEVLPLRNAS